MGQLLPLEALGLAVLVLPRPGTLGRQLVLTVTYQPQPGPRGPSTLSQSSETAICLQLPGAPTRCAERRGESASLGLGTVVGKGPQVGQRDDTTATREDHTFNVRIEGFLEEVGLPVIDSANTPECSVSGAQARRSAAVMSPPGGCYTARRWCPHFPR